MLTLPGYRITDKLIENKLSTLYKAISMKDDKVVAVKHMHKKSEQSNMEIVHEYHVTKDLTGDHVLRPLRIEKQGKETFLVTELFSGMTLEDHLETSSFNLKIFLKIAAGIVRIVASIHQEDIIHKSLHPRNILLNLKEAEIKITGFHQSTRLSSEMQYPNISPFQLKESVAYMSPEQTGRMNRILDYRTDIYSLGIIFYEMLTGKLPFQEKHPAEMIYSHLAKKPIRPNELNQEIPSILADIIMNMLEKIPESRYQSLYGLKADLDKCLTQLNATGEVTPFRIREGDQAILYEKPSKLYGRENAVKQLLDGFQRVRQKGTEVILIPGPSGIGKTALVNEIHKPLIREKGYFISGKFVQLQKQTPYAPLIHAFQELIRQILSEGAESSRKWSDAVKLALGSQTSVIANFIPEISWLIGSQPDMAALPPQGVHNRFRHAVRKFIGIFAKKEHPLVLFLDDLQWADEATLDLIDYLASNAEDQYVFIIGAYRNNEIHVGHPLDGMVKLLKEKRVQVKQIPIERLSNSHINEWINDTLGIASKDAAILGDLVYRVTEGNPFFTVQLFQSLYEEKIITFQPDKGGWQVHFTELNQLPISDTILDFLLNKINKLPKETKKILQLAACFGNRFDLKSLSTISGKRFDELASILWHGLKEGLVLPMDAGYKWVYPNENMSFLETHPPSYMFSHDKVQQAFYVDLPHENREFFHLNIGLELVNHYDQNQIEENIFEIVNHLNHSWELLSREQKMNLTEWNWMAGERAKERAATEAALHFYSKGYELLLKDRWKHYDMTLKIMTGLGEAQYLNHLFDEAELTFDEILMNTRSNEEKLRIYNLKITLYMHIHQVEKAVNAGLEILQLFNWHFKKDPGKLDVAREYVITKLSLQRKRDMDLLELPPVTDKDTRLLMQTLINMNAPAYHVNQNLATILMLRALRLTLKYGDMDVTALVYNNYALTMSAGFHDYDTSYQFGKLAIMHTDKFQDNSLKARVYFVFGTFVNHWKKTIRYNIEYLERSQQLSIESGNLYLAGACSSFIGLILFIKGGNLQDVKHGIKRQLDFANKNEYVLSNDLLGEVVDWIDVLSRSDRAVNWEFPSFTDDPSAIIIHYTIRLQMTYLLQNETEAMGVMEKLETLVDETLVLVIAPDYYFYHALWMSRLTQTGKLSKRAGRAKLLKKLAQLEKWAKHSPSNYEHKYLIVKGELARTKGNFEEAMQLYHQAITLAEKNGFLQDTAIANSIAADVYLDRNLPKSARAYLIDAYQAYLRWGADRIAHRIYHSYSEVAAEQEQALTFMTLEKESLDINAIAEASGIISGEVVLNQLVMKLMKLVVTNAGAERGHLLLHKEGDLQLVATNYMNKETAIYDQPEKLNDNMNFANTIVNYVFHTREAVVLEEAFRKGEFIKDDYVADNQALSILCLPVVYQGKLTGVLYLENNQATYVFTQERILLLNLLASQAAISIENAYLYANLEAKVEERTKLLNEANQSLTMANESLAQSEHLRRRLLSNISHDLRSPIATIQGYVNAISDELVESPEQQQHYLGVIKKRLTSLNSLVQDLFDLAHFESGTAHLSMDLIPIDQLFTHLCNQFELEIKQAGLDYDWHLPAIDEEYYPLVEADVGRIEQVISNLVSNAVKHTKKGKIRIRLSFWQRKEVIFSVEDEGTGIAESDIPYVFDRFFTKNKGKQGSGLGLAISKEIIAGHNGRIWVTSEKGKGSIFSFSLNTYQ